MPAELVIGAVGLVALVSTFESVLQLYSALVESTQAASGESHILVVKIFLEQEKFDLFGQYVGILRPQERPLFNELPVKSQDMIRIVSEEIQTLLSDSQTLLQKYGISRVNSEPPTSTTSVTIGLTRRNTGQAGTATASASESSSNSPHLPKSRLTYGQRVRWVWKDNDKVSTLHRHLQDLNNTLWTTLSVQSMTSLNKALPSFVLPGVNDIGALSTIRDNARGQASSNLVADCAEMRSSTLLSLPQLQGDDGWKQLTIPESQLQLLKKHAGEANERMEGLLVVGKISQSVIIEYKSIRQRLTVEEKYVARNRIRQTAFQLLKARDPDVCLMQCAGVVEDSRNALRYGLVLKIPDANSTSSGVVSLEGLLTDRNTVNQANLGDRFSLAQSLAYAVLQWHASGWLHKAINTDNIVFIQTKSSNFPDITRPKLLGFGSARPDDVSEESLMTAVLPDGAMNLFRSPEYQVGNNKFHRSYDYYSLGVVLMAIGWWDSLDNLWKKFQLRQPQHIRNPKKWTEFLIDRVNTFLGSSCGEIYRTVVIRCLSGDFGLDENGEHINRDSSAAAWQKAFLFTVVNQLARCSA